MGSSSSARFNEPLPTTGLVHTGTVYVDRYKFCKFFKYIRFFFGIATIIAVYFGAVYSFLEFNQIAIGLYFAFIGVPIFLLEFGKFIQLCCGHDGCLCRFFGIILGFDSWSRGLLYSLMAIVCFMPDVNGIFSKVAGVLLLITGILYFVKIFQKKKIKTFAVESS